MIVFIVIELLPFV